MAKPAAETVRLPTASAVVADMIDAVTHGRNAARPNEILSATDSDIFDFGEYECKVAYRFADGRLEFLTEKEKDAFGGRFSSAVSRIRCL